MKKLLFTLALVLGFGLAAYAQPRAIGVRLGGDLDVSYEHQLGKNMIEVEAGLPYIFDNYFGFHAAATYDWIFNFKSWSGKGEWNWYPGVGLAAGWHQCPDHDGHGFLGVAGRLGVEYNFWFPLQLSLDYRPVIGYSFGHGFYDRGFYGIALGVRYHF
ncbi:MAG: hypothetical protein Q4D14_02330 [Bacteroidales bacterium]|nr:hypothetical protein [Bacteroidales bacterium]